MRCLLKLSLVLVLGLGVDSIMRGAQAQSQSQAKGLVRTLSLDSGYFADSSRAFWGFGLELDGAASKLYDWTSSTFMGRFMLTRVLLAVPTYYLWDRFEYNFFVSNHEMGHGARFVAALGTPDYQWASTARSHRSIFGLWIEGLVGHYHDGASASASFSTGYSPPNFQYVIAAAGMNNSQEYAEAIEDQMTLTGGHLLQYIGYARAKKDAATYVDITDGGQSGDVLEVLNFYAAQGYGVSADDMKAGSLVSLWASSTNWSLLWGGAKYLFTGQTIVRPFYVGSVRLPDVSHFSTSRGLSYKVRTGLKTGSGFLPASIEYVYKGDFAVEVASGYKMTPFAAPIAWSFEGFVNSVGGFGLDVQGIYSFSSRLFAAAGASYFSSKCLQSERSVQRYTQGASGGYETWASIGWRY